MCFPTSNVAVSARKNWEGDEIVNRPIIRAARYVPGTKKRFDIDIREFLLSDSNAVVLEKCREALEQLATPEEHALVRSTHPGAFDLRVRAVCQYLSRSVRYQLKKSVDRGPDQWLFPDETLANGGGDCEDHAFLLAAMLLASGISGYVIRVALGSFRSRRTERALDHAWVMYKTESGHWIVLDPLIYAKASRKPRDSKLERADKRRKSGAPLHQPTDTYEYIPRFVFNDAHLWAVHKHADDTDFERYVKERERFWDGFDPSFATSVHNSLFDDALGSMSWVDRQYVKAVSLAADANIATYDPRDHFDNGYIGDGWARIHSRLATGNLNDFALACHAIADFYAHSTWGVFGERIRGKLQTYNPAAPSFSRAPDYSEDGIMPFTNKARFTVNDRVWKGTRAQAAEAWSGQIVSGRYAQHDDPHQGTFESVTNIPGNLRGRADYAKRTGLPHHNEIAVDGTERDAKHKLYQTSTVYLAAFQERRQAARSHIAQVHQTWLAQHGQAREAAE